MPTIKELLEQQKKIKQNKEPKQADIIKTEAVKDEQPKAKKRKAAGSKKPAVSSTSKS